MTLKANIKSSLLVARKDVAAQKKSGAAPDTITETHAANLLGTLLGEIETQEKKINPARDLNDEEIVAIVKKFQKNLQETITAAGSGEPGTVRFVQQKVEADTLAKLLPRQMTEVEVETFVREKASRGLNLGQIMGLLKAEKAGLYDGKSAKGIVDRVLSES